MEIYENRFSCITLGLTFCLFAMTGAVAAETQEKEFIVFAAASLTGITGDIGPMFEEHTRSSCHH